MTRAVFSEFVQTPLAQLSQSMKTSLPIEDIEHELEGAEA